MMQALQNQQGVACSSTAEFWKMCQERDRKREREQQISICGLLDADGWPNYFGKTSRQHNLTSLAYDCCTGGANFATLPSRYSAIANLLDYPASVVPAISTDHNEKFEKTVNNKRPLSELNKLVQQSCLSVRSQSDLGKLTQALRSARRIRRKYRYACKSCAHDYKKSSFWRLHDQSRRRSRLTLSLRDLAISVPACGAKDLTS